MSRWDSGKSIAAAELARAVVLAERDSAPLLEILRITNKVSQNLFAEIVLRETARVRRGDASREAALKELSQFLEEAGIDAGDYQFEDGSGLSPLTLVTPAAVTVWDTASPATNRVLRARIPRP